MSTIKNKKKTGRPSGVLNKNTIWLREELDRVDMDWALEYKHALLEKDYKRCEVLALLLPYLNPKLKEQSTSDSSDNPVIEITYK